MRDLRHLLHRRFKLPKGCKDGGGRPLTSFVVRELDGVDELDASREADKKVDPSIGAAMIRLSLVEVNGQEVEQPYVQLDGWNQKARRSLTRAFELLNSLSKEEEDFLEAASEDTTPRRPTEIPEQEEVEAA